ncbi:hypothetical protein LC092_05390 [Stappia stellulata]|uniref:hypothetical protein n=1 Tax=Stappia stellulata TaxID=71235 RepID=UPI001CD4A66B|nr:hypothetical protein [Stappia stellulata]MCA1241861.1 hypothetical protein [Stappia stellulata]
MQDDGADQDPKKTLEGAHRPGEIEPDEERAAKIGDTAATAQAALDDLAAMIEPDEAPDQPSLLDDEACLFGGPVEHVAETFRAAKGRGRPKGSKNKANQAFRDYLLKLGYRHPGLNLADLANADPHQLAGELSQPYRPTKGPHAGELVESACTPADALALIMKANEALMPYFESKRPTETIQTEQRFGVMVIHQSEGSGERAPDGIMSLTGEVRKKQDNSDT